MFNIYEYYIVIFYCIYVFLHLIEVNLCESLLYNIFICGTYHAAIVVLLVLFRHQILKTHGIISNYTM